MVQGVAITQRRGATRMAQPRKSERSRRHACGSGQHVVRKRDPGETKHVVEDIKRHHRHQPRERNKAPAFSLYAGKHGTQAPAGLSGYPIGRDEAGREKGDRRAQRATG